MNTQSLISWNYTGSDHTGFYLERSLDSGSNWSPLFTCVKTITEYTDENLWWGSSSWYRVSATNEYGLSPTSSVVAVFIHSPAMDIPSLTATQPGVFESASYLEWTFSGSSQGVTERFDLERSDNSGSTWGVILVDGTGSNYTDLLSWGDAYWYRIRAFGDFGLYSEYNSPTASIYLVWPPVPAPDTITANHTPEYEETGSISWTFTGSTDHASGFVLQRAVLKNPFGTWTDFGNIFTASTVATTSYADMSVTFSHDYTYRAYTYSGSDARRSEFYVSVSMFVNPAPAQLWAWQVGTNTQSIAFWNSNARYTMSVSRSSDGGATWDGLGEVAPIPNTNYGGYYYIDNTAVEGEGYHYKVQEIFYPLVEDESNHAIFIMQFADPTVMALAFAADSGFQFNDGGDTVWEKHTASLHVANVAARKDFGALAWILGGDNGYVSNTFHGGYEGQAGKLIGPSSSIFPCLGNHDLDDMGLANYQAYFKPPYHTWPSTTNRYYTRSFGTVNLFFLDATTSGGTHLSPAGNQYPWLSESLASSRENPQTQWRIAIVHVPAICSSGSHSPNATLAAVPWREWGIDAVYAGHVHWAERIESSSVSFINNSLMGSDKRAITTASLETKWYYEGVGDEDYIWNLLQFESGSNRHVFSSSFYSASAKVADTGVTTISNAMMDDYSLVLMKPWYAAAKLTASNVTGVTQSYLSWSFDGDFSMSLYRSENSGSTWPVTYSLAPGTLTYLDEPITFDISYSYAVQHRRFLTEPMSNMVEQYVFSV